LHHSFLFLDLLQFVLVLLLDIMEIRVNVELDARCAVLFDSFDYTKHALFHEDPFWVWVISSKSDHNAYTVSCLKHDIRIVYTPPQASKAS
jgi:hypothetical protein